VESLREVSQTLAASVYPAADYLAKVQKSTTTLVDQFQTSFVEFHNELKHTRELYKKISAMVARIPEQSLISLQKSADDLTSVAQYFQTERDAVISAAGQVSSSANRMQDSIFKLQESMVTSAASQEEQLKSFTNEIKSTRSSLDTILRHFEQVLLDLSALPEQSALRQELISLAGELSQFGEILQSSSTIQNKAFAHHEMLSQEIQALHRHFSAWEASAQQLLDQMKQSSDFLSDDRFILDDKDAVLVGSLVSKRRSHAAGNRYIDGSKFQSLWNKIREFWSNHS
jgi:predicted  nucleic acid-binding Zn-ribbon protein